MKMSGAYLTCWALSIAMGSIHFGYFLFQPNIYWNSITWIYGMDFESRNKYMTWCRRTIPFSAAIFAFLTGLFIKYGKRKAIFFGNALVIASWVLKQIHVFPIFVLWTAIEGGVIGIMTVVNPVFLNNISPIRLRGVYGALVQQFITVGIWLLKLLSLTKPRYTLGEGSDYWDRPEIMNYPWRWLHMFPAVPALIQMSLLLFVFKDEINREVETTHDVAERDTETQLLNMGLQFRSFESSVELNNDISFRELFSKTYRRQLLIGGFIIWLQQFSGVNMIIAYAYYFDIDRSKPYLNLQFIICALNMVYTLFSLVTLHHTGRKFNLFAGFLISCGCNCILFQFFMDESGEEVRNAYEFLLNWVIIFTMILFIVSYSVFLGSVSWVYVSDILPAKGVAMVSMLHWISNLLINDFPTMVISITESFESEVEFDEFVSGFFFLFGGTSLLGVFIVMLKVKETKNLSFESIVRLHHKI